MTCHLAGNRQMIMVGGSNTSHVADDCDAEVYGLAVLDLTGISWGTVYNAEAPSYEVPEEMVKVIGGS